MRHTNTKNNQAELDVIKRAKRIIEKKTITWDDISTLELAATSILAEASPVQCYLSKSYYTGLYIEGQKRPFLDVSKSIRYAAIPGIVNRNPEALRILSDICRNNGLRFASDALLIESKNPQEDTVLPVFSRDDSLNEAHIKAEIDAHFTGASKRILKEDDENFIKELTRWAELGSETAGLKLGNIFIRGYGHASIPRKRKINMNLSAYWYWRVARQFGSPEALFGLAIDALSNNQRHIAAGLLRQCNECEGADAERWRRAAAETIKEHGL